MRYYMNLHMKGNAKNMRCFMPTPNQGFFVWNTLLEFIHRLKHFLQKLDGWFGIASLIWLIEVFHVWWFQPRLKNITQNGNLPQVGVEIYNETTTQFFEEKSQEKLTLTFRLAFWNLNPTVSWCVWRKKSKANWKFWHPKLFLKGILP